MISKDRYSVERARDFLPDYLFSKGIDIKKPFHCLNPLHNDRNPSMSYFAKGKNVHCFSCGESYDIFNLVGMDYSLISFLEQYNKVCEIFGIENSDETRVVSINSSKKEDFEDIMKSSVPYPEYLLRRGISKESCDKYNLFEKDGRVYFPIYFDNVCCGWSGRAVSDDIKPKYKNSTGTLEVWNNHYLFENGENTNIYVTEGIIDAICIEQLGFKAVALCGSTNTQKLVSICEESEFSTSWNFILCGDPDAAGEKMNLELLEKLSEKGIASKIFYKNNGKDIADLYLEDKDNLKNLLIDDDSYINPEAEKYSLSSNANYLDEFFDMRDEFEGMSKIPTGFKKIDEMLDGGLYPALYMIGAVASLGKTSFMLQIADQLSDNGYDVLFFTLEQSKYELMAKSLSRISAQLDTSVQTQSFTARELLSGKDFKTAQEKAFLNICRKQYSLSANGLFIFEGLSDIGTEEIRKHTEKHIRLRQKQPVVIVDYLQILKPSDPRTTDKQNVDRAVVELKRMSRDLSIPVIAVSSFNRENYRNEVSMEAFKESGAVEYSADVLFGMQLKGTGSPGFNINIEKNREPRNIELVMLKNRNGLPYAKVNLNYRAKYSLFLEN